MGRNDLCWCGSGKKEKRCHDGIHPDSVIARTIKLHHDLDRAIASHFASQEKQPLCGNGCNECCKDYFLVTMSEFDIILDKLAEWSDLDLQPVVNKAKEQWESFVAKHPDKAENIKKDMTGNEDFKHVLRDLDDSFQVQRNDFQCLFLSDCGSCLIYNVRPFVCRSHGLTYGDLSCSHTICEKIGNNIKASSWLMDSSNFEERMSDLNNIHSKKHNVLVARRAKPLFYSVYYHFVLKGLKALVPSREYKFNMPFDVFADRLVEVSMRK